MVTTPIEVEISRFLRSPEPEVLCLQGDWGVGKTYSWNRFLQDARDLGIIALERYAYVSLFGLDSLDQLKYTIFENTVRTADIGITPSLTTFEANAAAVSKSVARKSLRFLSVVPGAKEVAGVLPSLSFLGVRKQLVCIDDLERRGDHLNMKDVLGLVSFLRDQRACKVVLILNDDALDDTGKGQFKAYHEKVIDTAVTFAPSSEDCARIAIRSDDPIYEQVAKNCVELNIANIRVIKKAERFVRQLEPLLDKFDSRVMKQAIHTTVLCAWIKFSENTPSIDFVRHKRPRLAAGADSGSLSKEESRWNLLLEGYGLTGFDEFDQAILEGIDAGYFDPDLLAERAAKLEQKIAASEDTKSIENAWARYHGSFDADQAEVIEAICDSSLKHISILSPVNLNGTIRLLKGLGQGDKAAELLKQFMDSRVEPKSFYDLDEYPFGSDITEEEVRSAFKQKFESFTDQRPLKEVVLKVSQGSWGIEDIEKLAAATVEDFYTLFKATHDPGDLSRLVRGSIQFGTVVGLSDKEKGVAAMATEALKRIGQESAINRLRVQKFGITVD